MQITIKTKPENKRLTWIEIEQIEAMPTAIGKKLRSRKVKMACERRQNELAENQRSNSNIYYIFILICFSGILPFL